MKAEKKFFKPALNLFLVAVGVNDTVEISKKRKKMQYNCIGMNEADEMLT